eukprot:NODE_8574_length_1485_cov_5.620029.p1 GENE.NODE_8574_length_1485_cov_5.620029~~NODE_8574_length_1485_cov_5.620029.p1  ORF type:complete len:263 (-),score=25.86 NODE_8574_length_1485_cov_5.620029:613-1401(-)
MRVARTTDECGETQNYLRKVAAMTEHSRRGCVRPTRSMSESDAGTGSCDTLRMQDAIAKVRTCSFASTSAGSSCGDEDTEYDTDWSCSSPRDNISAAANIDIGTEANPCVEVDKITVEVFEYEAMSPEVEEEEGVPRSGKTQWQSRCRVRCAMHADDASWAKDLHPCDRDGDGGDGGDDDDDERDNLKSLEKAFSFGDNLKSRRSVTAMSFSSEFCMPRQIRSALWLRRQHRSDTSSSPATTPATSPTGSAQIVLPGMPRVP